MNKLRRPVTRYFRETHSLLYSYLISLPLLLLYEVLIVVSQPAENYTVRVKVDIWIKTLFSYFSLNVLSITLIVVALIGLIILYRERDRLSTLKFRNFIYMLGEAVMYAIWLALILGIFISGFRYLIQVPAVAALTELQKIALSLGAGLYEELFFRVLLVSGLLYIFKIFMQKNAAFVTAIVVAALLFSAVHYFGPLGDLFTIASFLFRFFFGIALNIIFLKRGFGIAAWTHAFFDIMAVAFG